MFVIADQSVSFARGMPPDNLVLIDCPDIKRYAEFVCAQLAGSREWTAFETAVHRTFLDTSDQLLRFSASKRGKAASLVPRHRQAGGLNSLLG